MAKQRADSIILILYGDLGNSNDSEIYNHNPHFCSKYLNRPDDDLAKLCFEKFPSSVGHTEQLKHTDKCFNTPKQSYSRT